MPMLSELDKILQSCYSHGFVGTQVYTTQTGTEACGPLSLGWPAGAC